MSRIPIVIFRSLVIAALLFSVVTFPIQTASASTAACGSLLSDATWSLINSPYVVCLAGVTVPAGKTLTIDPGVIVQFAANSGNKINVQGTLVANGTAAQVITFTGVTAIPGSWGGISAVGTALTPSHVSLNYVTLEYGGALNGAQVYADQAVISVTHSLIRFSAGNGVYTTLNTPLDAHAVSFVGNGQHAIQLNQPSTDLLMTGLTASGNGNDGVYIAGSSVFHGQKRWVFPGIPYIVDGPIRTDLGDVLTIDPGNTIQFTPTGWLYVRGRLNALGTASKPILLTGLTQAPGAWQGIFIDGGVHQAVAQLDYVTVEYGGSASGGANIHVSNGRLIAAHSIIRFSSKDGIRFDSNWGGSILESQIVNNALYGIYNGTPARAVLATNNWWGDASGPHSDVVTCISGIGANVTAGVLFLPVLSAANAAVPFPLSNAPIVTLTPRRWFAPADNQSQVYFDIKVRDGNGAPIPGRTVRLTSNLGNPSPPSVTDPNGQALAFLTAPNVVGDAVVTASLDVIGCEGALSPETTVTFTALPSVTDLMPNAPASYFDGDIEVKPMPVVVGVETTITAKLSNPLATPVTVDVAFRYTNAGIGLVVGPIKEIFGQVIPANSSVSLSAAFLPGLSGHYWVEVTYTITAIGLAAVLQPQAGGSGSRQLNLYAGAGSLGSPTAKESMARAGTSFKLVSKIPAGPTLIQKGILGKWWDWASETASEITAALGLDPPRQDYNQVTLPVWYPIPPVQADANISALRAGALNAVNAALSDVMAYGSAAATAMDRYGGATEANNLQWASEQANELLYYEEKLGAALLTYADRLDAFVVVLQNEGETQITVSVSDIISYQQRLATGFSTQEIADAKLIGWTDAQIEAQRLAIIAAKPADVAGNLLEKYTDEASVSRALGNALLFPPTFNSSVHVSGSAGLLSAPAGNTMAQVFNSISTIQLANPHAQTELIDVKARRIDLPADWTVDISPVQISLTPGQQTTVTVSVIAGSPVPQGSTPRVAVEGYAGSELLGGVVISVLVPDYRPFDGKVHLFLPLVSR